MAANANEKKNVITARQIKKRQNNNKTNENGMRNV